MLERERESDVHRLDDGHVIEPVDVGLEALGDSDPILTDVTGRTWRLRARRRNGEGAQWLLAAAVLVAVAILITALLQTI